MCNTINYMHDIMGNNLKTAVLTLRWKKTPKKQEEQETIN